jgi:hypothetical protein
MHTRIPVSAKTRASQPATLAATYVGLAFVVTAVGLATGLSWRVIASVAVACGVLAVAQIARARLALARRRREADALIRSGVRVHPASELLVWRAAELTSDRNRRTLSRSLRTIMSELQRRPFTSPIPLDRRAVWPYRWLVEALAARVGQLERPVSARGMVLVEELLTDGFMSPLYIGGEDKDVAVAVERCLRVLEGEGGDGGVVVDFPDRFRNGRDVDFDGPRAHSGGSH